MPALAWRIDDGRCRQESDQFYGIQLVTSGGYVSIAYRNSSNGYYGGSLERDQSKQEPLLQWMDMIEIWQDYSA